MSTLEAQLLESIGTASATNQISSYSLAVSPGGDVYVTGKFFGILNIGGGVTPISSTGAEYGSFLAKYSSTLTPTLLTYMGGTNTTDAAVGNSVAVSSGGDVYVTGEFLGILDIGGGVTPITSTGTIGSGFLAKYSSTLTPALLTKIDSTVVAIGNSVAVSSGGDVYVTGNFGGILNIGGGVTPITTTNAPNGGFLAKYSSTLTPTLLTYMGGTATTDYANGNSVTVSSGGDVYVTGFFGGILNIGGVVTPISTTSTNGSSFLARYSSILTPTLLTYMGGTATTDYAVGNSVAVSSGGDVYVTGYFNGTLAIAGGVDPITNTVGTYISFLAKYSSTLTPALLKKIDSTVYASGSLVAVSSGGDVYVTGFFDGTLNIGGGVTPISTTTLGASSFLAKYSSTLTPTLLKYIGGTNTTDVANGKSLAISSGGDVYVTGFFGGILSIGDGVPPITNTSAGIGSFLAKYLIILPATTTTTTRPTTTTTTTVSPTTTTTTTTTTVSPTTTTTTTHNEPICLVSGTPILTDQGILAIEKIDTAIHTIGNQRIVAVTKAITPEKNLICFEPHSVAINCPTKRTIMTPGHEVLYKGKLVQAKHFVGKLNGVHTVPYDGKVVYNVLLQQHGVMSVNNMVVETLHPENKVAKNILNAF